MFRHRGMAMAFRRPGPARGPAVLFLHNGGTSGTIWRHQAEALAPDHDVVVVDLPGFGASPRPPGGIDHDGYVSVIEAFVDQAGLAPVTVVGNCMGANIAASLARRRPDVVAGLVLVNPLTAATFSAGGLGPLHRMERWLPRTTRGIRRLSRRMVAPRPVAVLALRRQLGRRGRGLGLAHDPELLACNLRPDQMPALVDVLDDMDAYAALDGTAGEIRGIPVWTVWGAENRILSASAGRHLDDDLRPGRAEVLDGCGHLPMLEDPDAVTDLIRAFLASLAERGAA